MFGVRDPSRAKSFSKCPECADRVSPSVARDMLDAIVLDQLRHNKALRKREGLR